MKTISWNTGRSYTANGQRIAAGQIGKDVIMVDYDRCIEYLMTNCKLNRQEIMHRYDSNTNCQYPRELQNQIQILTQIAKSL